MSEYRKKLDGFTWPSHLDPEIRWLARDRSVTLAGGDWFGFLNKPNVENGCWYASDLNDFHYGIGLSMLVLPPGRDLLLLCRDDYMSPTKRSVTFHSVNSGDGESFLWGEVPHDEVRAICGEFANPGQDHLSPVEILHYLGAMDGKRRKITITVEDVA